MVYELDEVRSQRHDHPIRPDLRKSADDVLARARSRDRGVVTLDTAGSPADSAATVVLPRYRVTAADPRTADPDCTQTLPAAGLRAERR